jgi:hypothetical protein
MIELGRVLPKEEVRGARIPTAGWCMRCWNVVEPRLDNIKSGQGACEYCGGKRRFTDAEARALARRWGYEPNPAIPYVNDATKWPGKCLLANHYCEPVLNSRFQSGPCQTCATHGFQPAKPAFLYLVAKPQLQVLKVGICGASEQNGRLAEHGRQGWQLLHKRSFSRGSDARRVEKAVIDRWRQAGWPFVLDRGLAYDGYTETVSMSLVTPEQALALIDAFTNGAG